MNAPQSLQALALGEEDAALPEGLRSCEPAEFEFTIVLLPGFSQLCLASLVEPLHIVNNLTRSEQFRWRLACPGGSSVKSAAGFELGVSTTLDDENNRILAGHRPRQVFFCSGEGVQDQIDSSLIRLVRSCVRLQIPVVALGSATFILAHAGLLADAACTVHWPKICALSERYGRINVQNSLFVGDGLITTCAGEFAAFDLVIDLIGKYLGNDLVREVCALVLADRWRSGEQRQSAPLALGHRVTSSKLVAAARLMEQHVDDKISIDDLARQVRVSRRQIERLFRQHLGMTPWQYYTALRLERARQLVRFTTMPIIEIAVACGFETASHFTKCFRSKFNISPSSLRRSAFCRV